MPAVLVLLALSATPVWVETGRCPPSFDAELRRLLAIELHAPLLEAATDRSSGVHVVCSRDTYSVTLTAPRREARVIELDVAMMDPLAAPRTVSLVVAEALATVWATPEKEETHLPEPVPAAVAEPVEVLPRFEVGLDGTARAGTWPSFGGGLFFDARLLPWLGLRVSGGVARGSSTRAAGVVLGTLVDGAVLIDARWDQRHWLLRGGLGVRAGVARLEGVPDQMDTESGSVSAPMVAPEVAAGVEFRPVTFLGVGVNAEGGWWTRGLEGLVTDEGPARISGFFGLFSLSLGVRW